MKRFIIFICALFVFGACNAATLNVKKSDGTTTKILLDTTQRTNPALAMRIENKIYYANLDLATSRTAGNVYVSYANKTYAVRDNMDAVFFITTTPNTTGFNFKTTVNGTLRVYWGDGTVDEIVRPNTTETTYSHNYAKPGEYKIGFNSDVVGYAAPTHGWSYSERFTDTAVISFERNANIALIDGSLGALFPTIGDGSVNGTQPRFYRTFLSCQNLGGTIPENLFDGIHGAPASDMFSGLFYGCANLGGTIPPNLFAGIRGAPTLAIFAGVFRECGSLTGPIPENLFAGLVGAPSEFMFYGAFGNDVGLTGIPEHLFDNLSGPAAMNMFQGAFSGCTSITGPSARINGEFIYNKWPYNYGTAGVKCYENTSGLSDWDNIPSNWK